MNQKPIILAREEYAKAIIDATNSAPLPAFVKIDVLNGLIQSLNQVAQEEYAREKAEWDKNQNEEEN